MEDKEQLLISYLAKKGFQSEHLEAGVYAGFEDGQPFFNVSHQKFFGDETMRYQLRFEWDHQFDTYRWTGYRASYRQAHNISHKEINGKSTAQLEERIKKQDWQHYFSDKAESLPPAATKIMEQILDDLQSIRVSEKGLDGHIAEELAYKYFPPGCYDAGYRTRELAHQLEKSREFIASSAGICQADLAYHVLSGHLDHIRETLMGSGISEYTQTDLNGFLERVLSKNPESFTCKASKSVKEGLIDFEIRVFKNGSNYQAEAIKADFVRFPDIVHGIFNGVDSAGLERKMSGINWNRDKLYDLNEEGIPEPFPEIMGIIEEVTRLAEDPKGKAVAYNLQLRYWTDAPYFDFHIDDAAWGLYHTLPKMRYTFPLETGAQQIYNLMCGRPVIAARLTDIENEYNKWHLFSSGDKGLVLSTIDGPSRKEIETFLTMLPVDDMYKDSMLNDLFRGNICTTNLNGVQPMQVNISIDLPAKALKISTLDGEVIPYNFRLEPTRQQQAPAAPQPARQQQNFFRKGKKRKGKGI